MRNNEEVKIGDYVYLNNNSHGCIPFLNKEYRVIGFESNKRSIRCLLSPEQGTIKGGLSEYNDENYVFLFSKENLEKEISKLNYIFSGEILQNRIKSFLDNLNELEKHYEK